MSKVEEAKLDGQSQAGTMTKWTVLLDERKTLTAEPLATPFDGSIACVTVVILTLSLLLG